MYIFNKNIKTKLETSQDSQNFFIFNLKYQKDVFLNNLSDDVFILYEDNTYLVLNIPVVYDKILDILYLFEKKIINYRFSLISQTNDSTTKYISDGKTYQFSLTTPNKILFYLNYAVNSPLNNGLYSDLLGFIIEIDKNNLETKLIPNASIFDFLQYIDTGSITLKNYSEIASYPEKQEIINTYYNKFNFLPEQFGKNIINLLNGSLDTSNSEKFFALVDYYNFITNNQLKDIMFFIYDFYDKTLSKKGISLEQYKMYLFPNITSKTFSNIFYFPYENTFLLKNNLPYKVAFFSLDQYANLNEYFNNNQTFSKETVELFESKYIQNVYEEYGIKLINSEFIDINEIFNISKVTNFYYTSKISNLSNGNSKIRYADITSYSIICYYTGILDIVETKNIENKIFNNLITLEPQPNSICIFTAEREFNIEPYKKIINNDSTRILLQKFPIKKDLYDSIELESNVFIPIKDVYDDKNNFNLNSIYIKYDNSSILYKLNLNIEFADNLEITRNINFILETDEIFTETTLIKLENGLGFTMVADENINNILLMKIIYFLNDENVTQINSQLLNEEKLKFLFKKFTDKKILLELDTILKDININKLISRITKKV